MTFDNYETYETMDETKLLVNELNRKMKKPALVVASEVKKHGLESAPFSDWLCNLLSFRGSFGNVRGALPEIRLLYGTLYLLFENDANGRFCPHLGWNLLFLPGFSTLYSLFLSLHGSNDRKRESCPKGFLQEPFVKCSHLPLAFRFGESLRSCNSGARHWFCSFLPLPIRHKAFGYDFSTLILLKKAVPTGDPWVPPSAVRTSLA